MNAVATGTKEPEDEVLAPGHTYGSVSDSILGVILTRGTGRLWLLGFLISLGFLGLFFIAVTYLFVKGVGIWGINIPVAWGFAIINFVWWIGIGHAGTLISAILFLFRQEWRTSINRFAEAMTLFAVLCAAMFPILHLGRPYLFYWLFPYPNTMNIWPQFRSPLMFDVFAVSTYATVSLLFWYAGLIPDLASLRDTTKKRWQAKLFGVFSLGWRGSAKHWERYNTAYILLAGLATPLVVSVHTIVSYDFAVSIIPGWHTTIFPPYFVAGAIYSGFAMVLTLIIPVRVAFGFTDFITLKHLDVMAKVMLSTGLIVAYGYLVETFMAFYSASVFEKGTFVDRAFGHYAPLYWALILTNILIPQLLWFKKVRVSPAVLWLITISINIGMWLERFIIVVQSLSHDFVPSSWGHYSPTVWDIATYLGTFGLFFTLMFLFIRFLPMISVAEMRELVHRKKGGH